MTNLLDEQLYPTEDFKELYHLRLGCCSTPWKCETFYGILKTRLNLENFRGGATPQVEKQWNQSIKIFIQRYF